MPGAGRGDAQIGAVEGVEPVILGQTSQGCSPPVRRSIGDLSLQAINGVQWNAAGPAGVAVAFQHRGGSHRAIGAGTVAVVVAAGPYRLPAVAVYVRL